MTWRYMVFVALMIVASGVLFINLHHRSRAIVLIWYGSIAIAIWFLAGALYQSTGAIRELLRTVSSLEEGDVTAEAGVTLVDEFGDLGTHLNAAIGGMREMLQIVNSQMVSLQRRSESLELVSEAMLEAAQSTSDKADAVSSASQKVGTHVTIVANAIQEVASSVREIAGNASSASTVASKAFQMANLAEIDIAKLEASSNQISSVVGMIASISDRTNLLALNAAIEAARAGDSGKGFTVVSNEVKNLANKTRSATEDVASRIAVIQSGMTSAIHSVSEVRGIVEMIDELQGSIASAVEEQAATVSEVGRSVNQVVSGTESIVENISAVADIAGEATMGATRNHASAAEVTTVAKQVQELVTGLLGQFTLGRQEGWTGTVKIIRSELIPGSESVSIPITAETTVDAFLDSVYLVVKSKVRLYTYNKAWVLGDGDKRPFGEMGTKWAKSNNRSRDDRYLVEVGISPGSLLYALKKGRR